ATWYNPCSPPSSTAGGAIGPVAGRTPETRFPCGAMASGKRQSTGIALTTSFGWREPPAFGPHALEEGASRGLTNEGNSPGVRPTHFDLCEWKGSAQHPGADRQGTRAPDRGRIGVPAAQAPRAGKVVCRRDPRASC